MNKEEFVNNYKIEKLDDKHRLNKFSSGNEKLDDYLINHALIHQKHNFNVNYLLINKTNNEIEGYFNILTDLIMIKKVPENIKQFFDDAPAVKIGRLALDEKYQKQGIGSILLINITQEIKRISYKIGIKYITVDAYCKKRKFYEKNGFNYTQIQNRKKIIRTSKRNPYTTIPMYISIAKI